VVLRVVRSNGGPCQF